MSPELEPNVNYLLKVVKHLLDRPRFVSLLRRRSPRGEQPLPLICLHTDTPGLLTAIRAHFKSASHRMPHAYADAARPTTVAGHGRLPLLYQLHEALSVEDFGVQHRIRFDLFRLANWLTTQNLDHVPGDDARKKLIRLLRERRTPRGTGQTVAYAAEASPDLSTKLAFLLLAALWPLSRFWLWAGIRVPGLGRQTRWFMKQPFMPPKQRTDFLAFAYRLTASRADDEDPDEIDKLLVHAFLEDLRHAYRRRLWKLHPWRRTAYATVLLDNVTASNQGWRLLTLINDVRNETGELDPLLVVAAGSESPSPWPTGTASHTLARAANALEEWREELPRRRQKQHRVGWYLPLRLSSPDGPLGTLPRLEEISLIPRTPPLLARPLIATLVGITAVATTLAPGYPYAAAGCFPFTVAGVSVTVDEEQCVGYSDSTFQVFGSDNRLRVAQQAVFAQNEEAEALHEADPGRPLVSLVYFAGLTRPASVADSDAAQAEELEGLWLQQRLSNDQKTGTPLLRVIVANGGPGMISAARVAENMLVPLAASDPTVLGVVGMDRSIDETKDAIEVLGDAGIPVVATTLSGNGLAKASLLYFQIVPDNATEAKLVADFAAEKNASVVTIYHPLPGPDIYVKTLVESLEVELDKHRIEHRAVPWSESADNLGLDSLCGDDHRREIAFYAGRHDDFGTFLDGIIGNCADTRRLPIIVADDAVTRFVADKEERTRSRLSGIEIHYVSKAAHVVTAGQECVDGQADSANQELQTFCREHYGAYRDLEQEYQVDVELLWPGERVGLAYDAAGLFLHAVSKAGGYGPSGADPNRAAITQIFREEGFEFEGVTGTINFQGSRLANNKALAILRIEDVGDTRSAPECVLMIGETRAASCPGA